MMLAEAKERIDIPYVWRHFGYEGNPGASCRCPWRKDEHPSFSVYDSGKRWRDFATDEGGDAVDFLARASGLSKPAACRKFIELAGGQLARVLRVAPAPPEVDSHELHNGGPPEFKAKPIFPTLSKGSRVEFAQLARQRGLGILGFQWASERDLLWFADIMGFPAWIISDSERVAAQARRMDGELWPHIKAKAYTLPGSWATWPIGINEAQSFPAIALCEGGPDFIAAHDLGLWEGAGHYTARDMQCAPVVMLGATMKIHRLALPRFEGKSVRILPHADDAGRKAAETWSGQLKEVGVNAGGYDFSGLVKLDGSPGKDLNDYMNSDVFFEPGKVLSC